MKKRIRAEFRPPECKKKINENYKGRGGVQKIKLLLQWPIIVRFGINFYLALMCHCAECPIGFAVRLKS